MEIKKIIFLISILSVGFYSNLTYTDTSTSDISQSTESKIQPKAEANQINNLLEKMLHNFDFLVIQIQYIGQIVSKDSSAIENKQQVREWLLHIQKTLNELSQKASCVKTNLSEIKYLLQTTSDLIVHLQTSIIQNFSDVQFFNSEPKEDLENITRKPIELSQLETMQLQNDRLINDLHREIGQAGLTKLNKFVRKIDALLDTYNAKYNITGKLKYVPILAVTASVLLYNMKQEWVDKTKITPLINFKKKFLGTSDWLRDRKTTGNRDSASTPAPTSSNITSEKTQSEQTNTAQTISAKQPEVAPDQNKISERPEQPLGEKAGFLLGDATFTSTLTLLSGLAYWTMGEESNLHPLLTLTQPITSYVKNQVKNYWQSLKGFTPQVNTTYKVFEDFTLNDERLVGIGSQIQDLQNLVDYITNPELFDRANASVDKGILLVGPSRCGKTLVAKALAGSINAALKSQGKTARIGFREVKYSDIAFKYEDGIKGLIEEAKQSAPCVLFVDEIHNMPLQSKESPTLINLLTGMSGINTDNDITKQVIVMAASNQPERLDAALLQPGRFGTIMHFEKPNFEQRKEYFLTHFKLNLIDSKNINIDSLVRQTEGCSYGCLESIIKHGKFVARQKATTVLEEYLQAKIDSLVYRIKDAVPVTELERKNISAYLAGKALTAVLLEHSSDSSNKLERVTIKGHWKKIREARIFEKSQEALYRQEQSKFGKVYMYNPFAQTKPKTYSEQLNLASILLAGPIAQSLLLKDVDYNYRAKDKEQAFKIIKDLAFEGYDPKSLPKQVQEQKLQEAYNLLQKCKQDTRQLLEQNYKKLENLSLELELKHTIGADYIRELIINN